jgi:hypothetical protein
MKVAYLMVPMIHHPHQFVARTVIGELIGFVFIVVTEFFFFPGMRVFKLVDWPACQTSIADPRCNDAAFMKVLGLVSVLVGVHGDELCTKMIAVTP